jgi:hypothetical protein
MISQSYYNTDAKLCRPKSGTDDNGEPETGYRVIKKIRGCLDLLGADFSFGQGKYNKNSTHIFICDRFVIWNNDYLLIDNRKYLISWADNPMNMNNQMEIELQLDSAELPEGQL